MILYSFMQREEGTADVAEFRRCFCFSFYLRSSVLSVVKSIHVEQRRILLGSGFGNCLWLSVSEIAENAQAAPQLAFAYEFGEGE